MEQHQRIKGKCFLLVSISCSNSERLPSHWTERIESAGMWRPSGTHSVEQVSEHVRRGPEQTAQGPHDMSAHSMHRTGSSRAGYDKYRPFVSTSKADALATSTPFRGGVNFDPTRPREQVGRVLVILSRWLDSAPHEVVSSGKEAIGTEQFSSWNSELCRI